MLELCQPTTYSEGSRSQRSKSPLSLARRPSALLICPHSARARSGQEDLRSGPECVRALALPLLRPKTGTGRKIRCQSPNGRVCCVEYLSYRVVVHPCRLQQDSPLSHAL